jgi:hypothetical protein
MKTLIVAVAVGFTAIGAMAQGYFNFGNRVPGVVDAKVTTDAGVALDGAAWKAQAYVGLTADSLQPVGTAVDFRTGAAAGYITSTSVTVPTIAGGTAVVVVMKAWEFAKGATFEASQAAGGFVGSSGPVNLSLAATPAPPTDMVGLAAFQVSAIPEPSTLALGVLGAAALLLRRRR